MSSIFRGMGCALLASALLVSVGESAAAQDGFALKAGAVFNDSKVDEEGTDLRVRDAAGWNIGVEYVLPILGVGVGVSGFTSGSPHAFSFSEGSLVTLAEANYFFNLPIIPISPYAGLNMGLGTYSLSDVEDIPEISRPEINFGDMGFQVGLRFQATKTFGVDAQYRRVSGEVADAQGADFESNQWLLGVTLF